MKIYMTATGCSGIHGVNINGSHTAQSFIAQIETEATSLDIGSYVEVYLGYDGTGTRVFSGYVKNIEVKEPTLMYSITCSDILVRAMDFFIASSTPENPFTRNNIKAEDLVRDVIALSGLTNYSGESTLFTFGINNPVEVNLTTSYDYARFIGDIIAYNLYADMDGVVHFKRRLPYIMPGDSPITTISYNNCISFNYTRTDKDLRNRVVVYGASGVSAEASASSPYLPSGYYKTVVVAAPTVFDNTGMAQQSADYNLEILNRLTQSLHLVIVGNPLIVPRQTLTISDAYGDLNGDWYIFSVAHSSDSSGFITSIELRR